MVTNNHEHTWEEAQCRDLFVEYWSPVVGYEASYRVSKHGRIMNMTGQLGHKTVGSIVHRVTWRHI